MSPVGLSLSLSPEHTRRRMDELQRSRSRYILPLIMYHLHPHPRPVFIKPQQLLRICIQTLLPFPLLLRENSLYKPRSFLIPPEEIQFFYCMQDLLRLGLGAADREGNGLPDLIWISHSLTFETRP